MRKNDFIKLLQTIDGNPEIVMWNGIVGDYQQIDNKLVRGSLVKETLSHYSEMCRLERCIDLQDHGFKLSTGAVESLKKMHKKVCRWERNQYVTLDDVKEKKYASKSVIYIQPKLRGEKHQDRLGSINY